MKIKKLYCHVISEKALDILNKYNIEVEYDLLVKNIINRNKDGICPFELEVLNIDNPNEAYVKIINKLKDFI